MQNMAENVVNRCQRDVCAEKKKVTKNFMGQICTTVSGLKGDMVVQIDFFSFLCHIKILHLGSFERPYIVSLREIIIFII